MKTRTTIRNCDDKGFDFVCPQEWSALDATEVDTQRFCTQCSKTVYLCVTDEETLAHARIGNCIARELPDKSELPVMYVGRPKNPPPVTDAHKEALAWTHREGGINDSLKNIDAERCCPKCEYPAPVWRTTCRVCAYEMGRMTL